MKPRKIVLLAVATLFVVAVALTAVRVRIARNQQQAALRAAGLPTTIEELQALCPMPAGENAADVYAQAFDLLQAKDRSDEDSLPIVGNPEEQYELGQRLSGDTLEACEACLAKHKTALELLHRASAMPECQFTPAAAIGPAVSVHHLASLRDCQRLLSLEALTAASDGRSDDAVAALIASTGLVRSLDREPMLIAQVVRFSCLGMSTGSALEVVNATDLDSVQLDRLSAAYDGIDLREPIALGMAGEWCAIESGAIPVGIVTRVWDVPGCRKLVINCLDALASDSMAEVRRLAFDERPALLSSVRPVMAMMANAYANVLGVCLQSEAQRRACVAVLAVLRFRLKEGRLPDALNELVPAYLAAVPQDPYDDQPLRYKKRDAGFVVYSVAKNQQDDGGTSSSDYWKAGVHGDLTFTVLH